MSPRTKAQIAQLRAERRAQILQAAGRVFSRKGFHAANVSDVAEEADISQGSVYHYFESKDDLLLAVFEAWESEELYQAVQAAVDVSASAAEQLRYLAQAFGVHMVQTEETFPANVEFWSHIHRNEAIREGFQRIFAEMRTMVAQLVEAGIAQGEFVDIDPDAAAALFIAVYDGLMLQWLADPQSVNWQTETATLVEMMFHGLLKTSG